MARIASRLEVLGLVGGVGQVPGQVDRHLLRDSRTGCPAPASRPPSNRAVALRKSNSGGVPTQSVAEVSTQVGTLSKRSLRRLGPTSRGAAASRMRSRDSFFHLDPVNRVRGRLSDPGRDLVGQCPASLFSGDQLDVMFGLLDCLRALRRWPWPACAVLRAESRASRSAARTRPLKLADCR